MQSLTATTRNTKGSITQQHTQSYAHLHAGCSCGVSNKSPCKMLAVRSTCFFPSPGSK